MEGHVTSEWARLMRGRPLVLVRLPALRVRLNELREEAETDKVCRKDVF
jgi:hypothetical protein